MNHNNPILLTWFKKSNFFRIALIHEGLNTTYSDFGAFDSEPEAIAWLDKYLGINNYIISKTHTINH